MITLDNLIGVIAPHTCLGCGLEGSQLCDECIAMYFQPIQSKCAGCFKLTSEFSVCSSCKKWLNLKHIYLTTVYQGVYEELLKSYKFKYARQNAVPIAKMMSTNLLNLEDYILCPIPTAPSRVRMRGFDHSKLITKDLSKIINLESKNLIKRKSNVRQLGSTRSQRIEHMKNEFYTNKNLKGLKILLVDDVMTSGATLSAASKNLKEAGAKEVSAVIFARKVS